jgi:hypothetical protein
MSYTRTVESRAYDAYFDPTYTTSHHMATDPRVAAIISTTDTVSGAARYKYFRRPIMPRTSALPAAVLLAPTSVTNPTIPIEDIPEPLTKTVEVQTMYRESEAQTNPYTPAYFLPPGAQSEVLLLESLKYDDGLPISNREIEMIAQARVKKDLGMNALPMTDEACFLMRKRMLETQELRELKIREIDIDKKFAKRLEDLQKALEERNEMREFLGSQRVASIRQAKLEDREHNMQSIRKSRIQVLRRLARKRNEAEPVLSGTTGRDIINEYFDRSSAVYAPLKREGAIVINSKTTADISSKIVPLNTTDVIVSIEDEVPNRLKRIPDAIFQPEKKYLSQTLPVGVSKGAGRVAEPRLTSAVQRSLRKTKNDVEYMHELILAKKRKTISSRNTPTIIGSNHAEVLTLDQTQPRSQIGTSPKPESPKPATSPGKKNQTASLLAGKPKGRPDTPDYASRTEIENSDHALKTAVIVLQKLIRGRAIQNNMFEGRHRQKEVITEMRIADEVEVQSRDEANELLTLNQLKEIHWKRVQQSTEDKVVGALASNLFIFLAQENARNAIMDSLISDAKMAIHERSRREAAESGRRQREHIDLEFPGKDNSIPQQIISTPSVTANNQEDEEINRDTVSQPSKNNQEEENMEI